MKGNLLIVDDEIDLSTNMKELLEDTAQSIFIAANGVQGLEILKTQKIDCVVSDVKMPVMDGLRMIEIARQLGMTMPFIFYTGHGSTELKKMAHELGATDLLTKPNFLYLETLIKKTMSAIY
jgi:CheY-like chemotaxis protein